MYAWFIDKLAQTGTQITIQCREELVRLFSRLPGVEQVVSLDAMRICDFKTVLVEIPHFLGIKTDGIPATAYLHGSEAIHEPGPLKVGVTWGCKAEVNRMRRACRLAELAPLASCARYQAVQFGERAGPQGPIPGN